MKRYLIRAGFNPLKHYSSRDFQINPLSIIGNNNGNYMFAYGVMNILWKDDVEIDQFYDIKAYYSDEEIAHINNNYDAFIIPMADAFRPDYIQKLSWYTALINKIKIPCIVVGIGYRGLYNPDFKSNKQLDDTVRKFCKAVLDHSAIIGLRGNITGEYLSYLGFKEDRHFTAIGCPSLYTYGILPSINPPSVDELRDGKLCLNANNIGPYIYNKEDGDLINDFINNSLEVIPNHFIIQQIIYEFEDMYIGNHSKWRRVNIGNIFREGVYERLAKDNRLKFFLDVPSWIDFLKDSNLFIGSRFHGTVASVLASVPHIFLPFNARTRELAEYHHFTCLSPKQLEYGKNVFDYIDLLDFCSFDKYQNSNLIHYLSFLKKNSINSILEDKSMWEKGTSPMEMRMKRKKNNPPTCIESLPKTCQIIRTIKWNYNYWGNKMLSVWKKS